MDTTKIEALMAAIQARSLSAAAEDLGYTPSGMSRLVASLEQEFGFALLARSKAGVESTPDCKSLIPYFNEFLSAGRSLHEATERIRGADVGTVRVGTAYPQLYSELAHIMSDFGSLHPNVQVDLVLANSTPLANMLTERSVDLCIISKREGNHSWTPLFTNEMVALVSADHPLGDSQPYPIERFASDPFIEVYPNQVSDNSRTLQRHGIVPNVRFTVEDANAARELVAAGLGVTLMNEIYARDVDERLAVKALEPRTFVEIGVAMTEGPAPSPAVQAFAQFAIPRLASPKR